VNLGEEEEKEGRGQKKTNLGIWVQYWLGLGLATATCQVRVEDKTIRGDGYPDHQDPTGTYVLCTPRRASQDQSLLMCGLHKSLLDMSERAAHMKRSGGAVS
jgi:hypothetical protein